MLVGKDVGVSVDISIPVHQCSDSLSNIMVDASHHSQEGDHSKDETQRHPVTAMEDLQHIVLPSYPERATKM